MAIEYLIVIGYAIVVGILVKRICTVLVDFSTIFKVVEFRRDLPV
jgi:hypothetical protein